MLIINYPHITKLKNSSACLQCFPRIRVAQIVMDYLDYGWSVEEMCHQHPYLSLAEAHAAMAYYFDHQEEIDTKIREDWEQTQR
jgi:hypothetical protein